MPYITHPMAVAALVGEHGGDEDEVIAALLHDAVEDGDGRNTLSEIHTLFGETVARYVELCSDAYGSPKPPWRERKEQFIHRIRTAQDAVKRIVAADKLHNVGTILRDLESAGPVVWDRFRGGRDGSIWYYREIVAALGENWTHPMLAELRVLVDRLDPGA